MGGVHGGWYATLLDSALVPLGRTLFEPAFMGASLDHALWLHRPFRVDDWLLYSMDSPSAGGARGFTRGSVFTRDGRLVASTARANSRTFSRPTKYGAVGG